MLRGTPIDATRTWVCGAPGLSTITRRAAVVVGAPTVFSAGVHKSAAAPEAGRALLKFLTAPEAAPIIKKTGMEPG